MAGKRQGVKFSGAGQSAQVKVIKVASAASWKPSKKAGARVKPASQRKGEDKPA
jgi:hypothetical protein